MDAIIRKGVYRTLRKLGILRNDIHLQAKLRDDFVLDNTDWNCLMFLLEERFGILINRQDEVHLENVANIIELVTEKVECKSVL